MTFLEAIEICFRKYFTVKGRALRSEYWYFYLFTLLMNVAIPLLATVVDSEQLYQYLGILYSLFSLGTIVPGITAAVRRLHDSGCSGWSLLWFFTIIGIPFVLYWLIRKGDSGPNAYGDPVLSLADEPSSTKSPASTPETPSAPSSVTQLESRDGVNMASDLRDTTK